MKKAHKPTLGRPTSGHVPYLALVLIATLLMSMPLFKFRLPEGHDVHAYPARVAEFVSLIAQGDFFPSWAPDFNCGYGSPLFSFNPPLFYYIAAAFWWAGANLNVSLTMTCFTIMLLSGYGMYLLMLDIVGKRGACLASIAYVTGPYLLCNLYVRAALAEYTAFACLPFVFWALRRAARAELRLLPLCIGAFSIAGVMLSHNFVALITMPVVLFYLLVRIAIVRDWRAALYGALTVGLGMGLSAYFWLPAFLESGLIKSSRFLETSAGLRYYEYFFAYLHQLVYSKWGYGVSVMGPDDGMSFRVGIVQIMGTVAGVLLVRRGKITSHRAEFWFFFWLVAGSAFMSCWESVFIWRMLPVLQYAEFPWRFLCLTTFALAACFGFLGPWIEGAGVRMRRLVFCGAVGALLLSGLLIARPQKSIDAPDSLYTPAQMAARYTTTCTSNEFEPAAVKESPRTPPPKRIEVISGSAQISSSISGPLDYVIIADAATEATVRLNVFYFPSWKITVDDRPFVPNFDNPHGVMDFSLKPGKHHVRVTLSRTGAGTVGDMLSRISIALLLGLAAFVFVLRRIGRRSSGGKMRNATCPSSVSA